MRAVPVSEALGAELVDFDIKAPCDKDDQAELRRLFAEHHLLLVRGDDVTEADQTRFVGYFGPVHVRADGKNETIVSNRIDPEEGTGQDRLLWHQDGTYGERPGIATSLWAQEVSERAVPTLFSSCVRVLDALAPDVRARLEPLHTVHLRDTVVLRTNQRWREDEIPPGSPPDRFARYEHPIVYRMPHIDRKTLLVSEFFTSHVVELPGDEGEALLQDLFSRLYAEDNVYAHHWRDGDLIIWDNLALGHSRPADMGDEVRRLRRQSLDGWYTADGVLDWPETVIAYKRQP